MAVRGITIFESLWSLWELIKTHWLASAATGAAQAGVFYVIWNHIQAAANDVGWPLYVGLAIVAVMAVIGAARVMEAFRSGRSLATSASFSATLDKETWNVTPHREKNIRDIFFTAVPSQDGVEIVDLVVIFGDELGEMRQEIFCSNRADGYMMKTLKSSSVCRHIRFTGVVYPFRIDAKWEPA